MTPTERELLAIVQQQQRTIQSLIDGYRETTHVQSGLPIYPESTSNPSLGYIADVPETFDPTEFAKRAELWRGSAGAMPKGEEPDEPDQTRWETVGTIPGFRPLDEFGQEAPNET